MLPSPKVVSDPTERNPLVRCVPTGNGFNFPDFSGSQAHLDNRNLRCNRVTHLSTFGVHTSHTQVLTGVHDEGAGFETSSNHGARAQNRWRRITEPTLTAATIQGLEDSKPWSI